MPRCSDITDHREELLARAIGLGERSFRKTYFPELRKRLGELEQGQELLQTIVDTAPTAIAYHDMEQRYILVNTAYREMVGKSASEILGYPLAEVLHPDVYRQLAPFVERALRGHFEDFTVTLPVVGTKDFRTCIKRCAPHFREGRVVGIVSTLSDITDLEKYQRSLVFARDAAEAGTRSKAEFLANMSHEMRTPLAGVLGMLELVLEMNVGAEERRLLEMAGNSARSLLRLISDVLDFSRLEAGVLTFESTRFSLEECVRAALEVVAFPARDRGLTLECEIAASVPETIEGDEGRLRQVLTNLVGNAVKFTHQGGIRVSVSMADDGEEGIPCLQFSVRDTGIGISPDKIGLIFAKFTQADPSTSRKYGGTGLGLAVSRQIVEKMGGRIWVESTPGDGSEFFFTLPAKDPEGGGTIRKCGPSFPDQATAMTFRQRPGSG